MDNIQIDRLLTKILQKPEIFIFFLKACKFSSKLCKFPISPRILKSVYIFSGSNLCEIFREIISPYIKEENDKNFQISLSEAVIFKENFPKFFEIFQENKKFMLTIMFFYFYEKVKSDDEEQKKIIRENLQNYVKEEKTIFRTEKILDFFHEIQNFQTTQKKIQKMKAQF